ncbi:glycosyltransferase [Phycicoccus duodecadis]|uniref:GT2 family glycosyltransferase n=1 Tax=Phycicoccus duodecadis TaxID=173053 RepID=A0A2N3YJY4_9MICO|nr:glycosyltransferase [Phycicoccus duodecadis]PKW27182.1 GT2 family glycosyltransferase [Phycicoccus duodecadis]
MSSPTPIDQLSAIIVHHRRPDDLLATVASVLDAGVPAERVLVVDNSEDPAVMARLTAAAAADRWRVAFTANHGYGAAVNHGVRLQSPGTPFTLVLTHETQCAAGDLCKMVEVLRLHPTVSVVGPATLRQGEAVWSRGGYLTPHLLFPRHHLGTAHARSHATDVDWVDGAIAVYRTAVLEDLRFREDFFLYMEETELHTRMRHCGWRVVTATDTSATQTTSGMPAFWACRNTVLFQAAHGTRLSRAITPWFVLLRTAVVHLIEKEPKALGEAWRGLRQGRRAAAGAPSTMATRTRHGAL